MYALSLPTAVRLVVFSTLASLSLAQFVIHDTEALNLTVVTSPGDEDVTITYKEPTGACNTALDTQKQFTGWVNVPGDYPTNLFFWFVEAREPTDSLTIWLNGGPGSSSMYGFFIGNGPCEVVERGIEELDTIAREWGWDRASNMLYIDQPNQVGFSYDTPTNGTLTRPYGEVEMPPITDGPGDIPSLNGTFPSMEANQTANTTEVAAMAVWHMVQGFFAVFPEYRHPEDGPVGVHLFAESYGGRYGPIFAETFQEQNERRANGELDPEETFDLNLLSLGIVNGCIDTEIETPLYLEFANGNTYGIQAIPESEYEDAVELMDARGGCRDLLQQCRRNEDEFDPDGSGDDEDTNDVCAEASIVCNNIEAVYYYNSGRGAYDIAADEFDPFPSPLFEEYLNNATVQFAIGSPVNFTMSNNAVFDAFYDTGDRARGGNIERLAALVESGVRVALLYGDRDYICNWFGGEAVSLAIAEEIGGDYGDGFPSAGYADIVVNDSYVGGAVREFGNLSFSRIYQAGHSIPSYQPETSFQVFSRVIFGTSVSMGQSIDLGNYSTEGTSNATETQDPPDQSEPTCWLRNLLATCDEDAQDLVLGGDYVVINGAVYASEDDWPGSPTEEDEETETMTGGVYTATGTPDSDEEDDSNDDSGDGGEDDGGDGEDSGGAGGEEDAGTMLAIPSLWYIALLGLSGYLIL